MTEVVLMLALSFGAGDYTRDKWLPVVKKAAEYYDMDWRLIDAVIQTESSWRPQIVSDAGAMGLTQLMPNTAKYLKVTNPFDPGQSIWAGAWYLRQMYDRFGSWELALAAYNAGPTKVSRCSCIPGIPETQAYVAKVMSKVNDNVKID